MIWEDVNNTRPRPSWMRIACFCFALYFQFLLFLFSFFVDGDFKLNYFRIGRGG